MEESDEAVAVAVKCWARGGKLPPLSEVKLPSFLMRNNLVTNADDFEKDSAVEIEEECSKEDKFDSRLKNQNSEGEHADVSKKGLTVTTSKNIKKDSVSLEKSFERTLNISELDDKIDNESDSNRVTLNSLDSEVQSNVSEKLSEIGACEDIAESLQDDESDIDDDKWNFHFGGKNDLFERASSASSEEYFRFVDKPFSSKVEGRDSSTEDLWEKLDSKDNTQVVEKAGVIQDKKDSVKTSEDDNCDINSDASETSVKSQNGWNDQTLSSGARTEGPTLIKDSTYSYLFSYLPPDVEEPHIKSILEPDFGTVISTTFRQSDDVKGATVKIKLNEGVPEYSICLQFDGGFPFDGQEHPLQAMLL